MKEKVVKYILKAVEKFLGRIVVVRRHYEENLLIRGFHSKRFHAGMSQIVVLGDDPEENKKKVAMVGKKLAREAERQVGKDRQKAKDSAKKKSE